MSAPLSLRGGLLIVTGQFITGQGSWQGLFFFGLHRLATGFALRRGEGSLTAKMMCLACQLVVYAVLPRLTTTLAMPQRLTVSIFVFLHLLAILV